ncbi:hypothetical protein ACOSQ2_008643 [Xanthoceras sorbifolium]
MASIRLRADTGWLRVWSRMGFPRPLLLCRCLCGMLVAIFYLLGSSLLLVESLWRLAAIPFLSGLRLPGAGSFFYFILVCKVSLLVHEMELLLVLLWRFWFHQNHAVHSAPLLSVEETIYWSKLFLADYQVVVVVPSVHCGLVVERWQAPSSGWVKINSDMAVNV